jgi:hypothetical protein
MIRKIVSFAIHQRLFLILLLVLFIGDLSATTLAAVPATNFVSGFREPDGARASGSPSHSCQLTGPGRLTKYDNRLTLRA